MSSESHGSENQRAAALENELLQLIAIIEGVCKHEPEIFSLIREQHLYELKCNF